MPDFTVMRQNMVKNQILPEEITNPFILHSLLNIPREKFVPRQLARIAYMDTNFPYNKGRILLRPATLAHLLQASNLSPNDKILYIASGTGYGPALLGYMGSRVIALDSEEILTQEAERLLNDLELFSVDVVLGPLSEGWEKEAPYDKIIIEGSLDYIPNALVSQMKENGEIVTFRYRKDRGHEAIKLVKTDGILTEIFLFDAFAPRLEAFLVSKAFVF